MKQCILCDEITDTKEKRVEHFNKFHKKQMDSTPEIKSGMSCKEVQRIWRGKYG